MKFGRFLLSAVFGVYGLLTLFLAEGGAAHLLFNLLCAGVLGLACAFFAMATRPLLPSGSLQVAVEAARFERARSVGLLVFSVTFVALGNIGLFGANPLFSSGLPLAHSLFSVGTPTELYVELSGGAHLRGLLARSPGVPDHQIVVLVPGAKFAAESWLPLAERLNRVGMHALALDGGSGEDALAVVRHLRDLGYADVDLIGASKGGRMVMHACSLAAPGDIDRVILLAPAMVEEKDDSFIEKMQYGSVLVTVAQGDRLSKYAHEVYDRAPDPKKYEALPGKEHAQHYFNGPNQEKLYKVIIDYLTLTHS